MVDALVEEARAAAPVVFLDFHAEATSEKVAMATWLDGRVTAGLLQRQPPGSSPPSRIRRSVGSS